MATHPYISGPGNVEQMIGFLRKNFPPTVTSETVKKFALAPNNESYIINALQFIGVIDSDGKRTEEGHSIFVLGNEDFPKAFEPLVRKAYKDLFEVRGEDAWSLNKQELTSYFRTSDKTSDAIGGRQAGVFQVFARLAGHETDIKKPATSQNNKQKEKNQKPSAKKSQTKSEAPLRNKEQNVELQPSRRDMAMTVRIEINLPSNGTQETYDSIFKSIRDNLLDG